jgi:hypothetical protein
MSPEEVSILLELIKADKTGMLSKDINMLKKEL